MGRSCEPLFSPSLQVTATNGAAASLAAQAQVVTLAAAPTTVVLLQPPRFFAETQLQNGLTLPSSLRGRYVIQLALDSAQVSLLQKRATQAGTRCEMPDPSFRCWDRV